MQVWILTSGFGSGHRSAAKALEEEYQSKGHTVVISDIVQLLYPKTAKLIYTVFSRLICPNSWLYNVLNQFGRGGYHNPKTPAALERELDRICPDMIVTTWSGCGRKLGMLPIPIHVCITDVGVHTGWLYPYAASYWVANSDVADQLSKLGVSPANIHVRGIPVREEFRRLPEKSAMHRTKHLLIMGGGLGIIPWLDELLLGLRDASQVKITVVAGKNQQLYQKLKKEYPFVQAIGFVNNIYDYLTQADFLISKPGGVSLFESIYATTPYIAMCPAYKHEMENASFIEKNEIGMVIHRREDACKQITELLADEQRCRTYQTHMVQVKRDIERSRRNYERVNVEYVG